MIVEMACVECSETFEVLTSNRSLKEMKCPDCGCMCSKIPSVSNWEIKSGAYRTGPPESNNNMKRKRDIIVLEEVICE